MKTFEEIPVYQKAKNLCLEIYRIDNEKYIRDFGFEDQIQRASISVLNNLAEGYERGSDREFVKFLYYSKGSAGEIRSLLNIAVELGYIDGKKYLELKEASIEISKQISNFIKYLAKRS